MLSENKFLDKKDKTKQMKKIKVGSDFSGVVAFNQAWQFNCRKCLI